MVDNTAPTAPTYTAPAVLQVGVTITDMNAGGDEGPVRTGRPQPDAGESMGEPVRERREGRRRVAAPTQRMLVFGENA